MEHEAGIHVAIAAEKLGEWFGVPITNTLLMSWFVILVLGGLAFFVYRRTSLIPGRLQSLFELMFESVLKFMEDTLESREHARRYFPLIVTIFLFVFVGNLMEFIPGVGPIGLWHTSPEGHQELVPLLRSMNTDLNMTLALAIISFLTIEISGILVIGFFKYFSRFFNFHSPIDFIVGIIEFVSELIRLVSFSFRLFGNIFAGEVLLTVIAFFVPILMPVPFMAFELFVGFMQAGIFAVLTLFFLKLAITEPAH